MRKNNLIHIISITIALITSSILPSSAEQNNGSLPSWEKEGGMADIESMPDPLTHYNRFMFGINDKIYVYFLRPVSKGYGYVVPEDARVCIYNAFNNINTPVRLINSLLQAKFQDASNEFQRFCLNTIYGVGGLFDPAKNIWGITIKDEDFGQTLGNYKLGHGFYFVIPVLGPSSLRDGAGFVVDTFFDPINYFMNFGTRIGISAGEEVNDISLHGDEYDSLRKEAPDFYLFIKDSYAQHRAAKVRK